MVAQRVSLEGVFVALHPYRAAVAEGPSRLERLAAGREEAAVPRPLHAAWACHAGRRKRLSRSGRSLAHGADAKRSTIVIGC
jgi:hypothetical protein